MHLSLSTMRRSASSFHTEISSDEMRHETEKKKKREREGGKGRETEVDAHDARHEPFTLRCDVQSGGSSSRSAMNANRIRIQSGRGVIDLSNLETGLTSPLSETRHVIGSTKKVERTLLH